jgi:hypothetical protein
MPKPDEKEENGKHEASSSTEDLTAVHNTMTGKETETIMHKHQMASRHSLKGAGQAFSSEDHPRVE